VFGGPGYGGPGYGGPGYGGLQPAFGGSSFSAQPVYTSPSGECGFSSLVCHTYLPLFFFELFSPVPALGVLQRFVCIPTLLSLIDATAGNLFGDSLSASRYDGGPVLEGESSSQLPSPRFFHAPSVPLYGSAVFSFLLCVTPLLGRECAEAGPDVVLDGVASLLQSISACGTVAQHFLSQPQWLTLLAALTHSGPLQVQRRGLRVLHRVVPAIRPVHVRRHMHIHKRMASLSFLVWCHHGALSAWAYASVVQYG
jgi:hypothetical protein